MSRAARQLLIAAAPLLAAAAPLTTQPSATTRPATTARPATGPSAVMAVPSTAPAAPGPAVAGAGFVSDDAHVFGPATVAAADAALVRSAATYQKQLFVETYAAVPAGDRAALAAAGREKFFSDWMAARAKARQANGVFVLICMDPRYVTVGAGGETRANGIFTAKDVSALRTQLQADLRVGRYDAALNGAVATVTRTYAARIKEAGR